MPGDRGAPRLVARAIERTFALDATGSVIGSAPRCAIRDTDSSVQANHCRVFRDDHTWFIEDLNSAEGTFVNGRRIAGVVPLVHGDAIRCAASGVELVFAVEGAATGQPGRDDQADLLEDLGRRQKRIAQLEAELASTRASLEGCREHGSRILAELAGAREAAGEGAAELRRENSELRIKNQHVVSARDEAERRAASNDTLIAELREVIDHLQRTLDGVEGR